MSRSSATPLLTWSVRHCNDDTNPVFYEVLDFSVHDLCDRDVITVVWRHNSDSVVFPVLVPKKHATGAVLFDALKSRPDVMSATGGSVECIRLLAVGGSRALSEIRPPTLLEPIIEVSHGFANGSNLHVRAEITPMDTDDSAVVWISFVITGGYVPKYYGEPVGVVIPKVRFERSLYRSRSYLMETECNPRPMLRHAL